MSADPKSAASAERSLPPTPPRRLSSTAGSSCRWNSLQLAAARGAAVGGSGVGYGCGQWRLHQVDTAVLAVSQIKAECGLAAGGAPTQGSKERRRRQQNARRSRRCAPTIPSAADGPSTTQHALHIGHEGRAPTSQGEECVPQLLLRAAV